MMIALMPRGLTAKAAAAYLGICVDDVLELVRIGHLSAPVEMLPGVTRFDRHSIDKFVDRLHEFEFERVQSADVIPFRKPTLK